MSQKCGPRRRRASLFITTREQRVKWEKNAEQIFDFLLIFTGSDDGQRPFRNRRVDEQRLGRVAHRRAGDLGIDGDGRRHLHIGVLIDIDMTVAAVEALRREG